MGGSSLVARSDRGSRSRGPDSSRGSAACRGSARRIPRRTRPSSRRRRWSWVAPLSWRDLIGVLVAEGQIVVAGPPHVGDRHVVFRGERGLRPVGDGGHGWLLSRGAI